MRNILLGSILLISSGSGFSAVDSFFCKIGFEDSQGLLYSSHSFFDSTRSVLSEQVDTIFSYGEIGGPRGFGAKARRDGVLITSHYHYAYYLVEQVNSNGLVVKAWQASYCVDQEYGWGPVGLNSDCGPLPTFPGERWKEVSVVDGNSFLGDNQFERVSFDLSGHGDSGEYQFQCEYLGSKF